MTSTSGPGISLMSEFAGLGYYAEIPAVVFDIQRAGPSTGLPTRTMQGDIASTAWLSHGDTRHVLLLPSSVEECYSMAIEAFDLAERLQTPVFVMTDLDLGMNTWMSDPFPYPETATDRGKRLTPEKLREIGAWGRYKDVDGDAIPYRTVPGDGMPAYFARGTGHNEHAVYSERPDDWVRNLDRIARKIDTAKGLVPPPEVERRTGASIGVIAYGTTHWGATESRDQLAREAGIETSYFRLRAYPFTSHLEEFVRAHDRVYLIEQNRDAQMLSLLKADIDPALATRLRSVRHYDGLPVDARSITDEILRQEGVDGAAATSPVSESEGDSASLVGSE
jgi:2-oxoglutarate ferredoxin oxidoreductase subunit alpha